MAVRVYRYDVRGDVPAEIVSEIGMTSVGRVGPQR
jgi:hypothetical protein